MSKIFTSNKHYLLLLLIFLNAFSFIFSQDPKIILLQFKTKYLRQNDDDDDDDWSEGTNPYEPDEDGENEPTPIYPVKKTYNKTEFLNEWFYNGIYTELSHKSSKIVFSLLTLDNAKFSLGECAEEKLISLNSVKYSNNLIPIKSNSKGGSDEFMFVSDLKYKSKIIKPLNFLLEKDDQEFYCGNIGFNLNLNNDDTNFVEQLKKNYAFNKYIWTINYQTSEDGILVFGEEPHFYENTTYYRSQYRRMYTNINKDTSKTSWIMNFDEIYLNFKTSKTNLKNENAELYIDHGLFIGTDDYKSKIDELFFNKLINDKICFREIVQLNFGSKDEYYVYYCKVSSFVGPQGEYSQNSDKAYFSFPDLVFYIQQYNKTFSFDRHDLFLQKTDYCYFMIVFKNNENNNVWKLGEPFFIKNKIVFDQDNKMIGFYCPNIEAIPNDKYIDTTDEYGNPKKQNKHGTFFYVMLIGGIVILVGILLVLAYFFGKKLNEQRKKRANELNDDDFDYNKENNALYKPETPENN